jgi:hypothetical protein
LGSRVNIYINFCLQGACSQVLLPLFATGVVDTGGKFAASVVDTGGKFAAGVVDIGGNFAASVVDTGGKFVNRYR